MAEEKDGMEFLDGIGESELGTDGLSEQERANLNNDGHVEFGEEASIPNNDSDGKGEGKKPASSKESKEEKKEKPEPDKDEVQKELEKIEKRRKDTERAFQKEHQKRLELEQELEKAKKQKKESSQKKPEDVDDEDDEDLLFDVDDPDDEEVDDPDQETQPADDSVKAELDEVKQKQEELEKKQALEAWERASEKVKDKHEDFEEVVYDYFYKAFEASPKVQEQFKTQGSTPEAAYQLGLKIKSYNDSLESDKAKTDDTGSQQTAEDTEQSKQKTGVDPSEALGGNSSGSAAKPSSSINDASDAVEAALAEL